MREELKNLTMLLIGVSDVLRSKGLVKLADELDLAMVKLTDSALRLEVIPDSAYGNQRFYPNSPLGRKLLSLSERNAKSFTLDNLKVLRELGFEIIPVHDKNKFEKLFTNPGGSNE